MIAGGGWSHFSHRTLQLLGISLSKIETRPESIEFKNQFALKKCRNYCRRDKKWPKLCRFES